MNDAIAAIYEAATGEEAFGELPGLIARAVGARSAVIHQFSPDGVVEDMSFNYWSGEQVGLYLETGMHRHDVWRITGDRLGIKGRAGNVGDYLKLDEFLNSIFYNEYFRVMGDDTVHCLGAQFDAGGALATIGLHRGLGAAEFTKDDVAWLDPLVPHLARAMEVRRQIGAAVRRAALAEAALDASQDAILILDVEGEPHFANGAARALLASGRGVALRRGGVRFDSGPAQRRFVRAVAEACARRGANGASLAAPRPRGAPLRVLVTPLSADGATRALVTISDPDAFDPRLAGRLAAVYGLTEAAADVTAALARGRSPMEIAAARGVSLATVRTQVRQALERTDARSIADLAALAASMPRVD